MELAPDSFTAGLVRDAALTLLLLASTLVARSALLRTVRRTEWATPERRLRWRSQIRFGWLTFTGLGLFVIWAAELRTAAVSLVAVAVALVIATKELIQGLLGAVLRATSGSFTVGDRIEVKGLRGDVIDTGLFATRVQEVDGSDAPTGRIVAVPNVVFLTEQVINESQAEAPQAEQVVVPLPAGADWQKEEGILHEAARAAVHDLAGAGVGGVDVRLAADGRVELVARLAVPARMRGAVAQAVLRRYLRGRGSPTD